MGPQEPSNCRSVKWQAVSVAGHIETEMKHQFPKTKLPKGLIGIKCTGQIYIDDIKVNCLLDTGSQVTTIPLSFHKKYLSHHPMQSLESLLEFEGANGQSVPYLWYVEVTLMFPKEFLGTDAEVTTLALVVPDLINVPQVLIVTNTLNALYSNCVQKETVSPNPASHGYAAVLKTLDVRHKQSYAEAFGGVTLKGTVPETVLAGHTAVLDGVVCLKYLSCNVVSSRRYINC